MKKTIRSVLIFITLIIIVLVGLLIKLRIQTGRILTDYSSIYKDDKYSAPVYVDGVEVIT